MMLSQETDHHYRHPDHLVVFEHFLPLTRELQKVDPSRIKTYTDRRIEASPSMVLQISEAEARREEGEGEGPFPRLGRQISKLLYKTD